MAQAATIDWSTATDDQITDADLIVALNLERLSDEEKAGFLAKMAETVQKAVIARAIGTMDDAKRKELDEVMAKNDPEALATFMLEAVPSFDDLTRQETLAFKRAMLTGKMPTT